MIISFLFMLGMISSGIMVMSSMNPVHSMVWLVLSFVNAAGMFILLNLDFVGMMLLMIYVGAIAVLFVFVIMMLNLSKNNLDANINNLLPLITTMILMIITQMMMTGKSTVNTMSEQEFIQPLSFTNPQILGKEFYSTYDIYMIIPSLILLVAMIGTMILTLSYEKTSHQQNLFQQVARDKY